MVGLAAPGDCGDAEEKKKSLGPGAKCIYTLKSGQWLWQSERASPLINGACNSELDGSL